MLAEFVTRDRCLSCDGSVSELSSGYFDEEPLRGFIANDPWGENPLPFLKGLRWEFVKCTVCGLTFHRRILSPTWNARRFEKWMTGEAIAEFDRRTTTNTMRFSRGVHFIKHALQIEALTRGMRKESELPRVLDFGCGDGEFVRQCAALGFSTVGVDRSGARQEKNSSPVHAEISDVRGSFHAITLFEVLEHLDDPRGVIAALKKLLIPGGLLVLETPNCSGITSINNEDEYRAIHPLDHINGFTPDSMRDFCGRLGFSQVAPPVSHVTCSLRRVVKSETKRILRFAVPRKTQQYFRLDAATRRDSGAA